MEWSLRKLEGGWKLEMSKKFDYSSVQYDIISCKSIKESLNETEMYSLQTKQVKELLIILVRVLIFLLFPE